MTVRRPVFQIRAPAARAQGLWLATTLLAMAAAFGPRPACAAIEADARPSAAPAHWWSPFGDRTLDGLVADAGGDPAAQGAVVRQYVAHRTLQVRAGLADKLAQAAGQSLAMVREAEPAAAGDAAEPRGRLLGALATRAETGQAAAMALRAELKRSELTLAALCHRERASLHGMLGSGEGAIPEVALQVPFRLPASSGAGPSAPKALQAAAAAAQRAQQLVEASDLTLRAQSLRREAGAETPLAVLEAYLQLVADADELALRSAERAMAWAELLQADQGAPLAALEPALRGTARAPRAP